MNTTEMKTVLGTTLFLLFTLSMFMVSSCSEEFSSCTFTVPNNGQRAVYNFSRLSRQEEWHTTNGVQTAVISVCRVIRAPLPCQNMSACVSHEMDTRWTVAISNLGTNLQSLSSGAVLEMTGVQRCASGVNYSAVIYFTCSHTEQEPVLLEVRDMCTLVLAWQTSTACPVDEHCIWKNSDFSSLQRPEHYVVEANAGKKFLLNVCGPIHFGQCGGNGTIAACEIDDNNKTTVIGQLAGHHMMQSDDTGIALIYSTQAKGPRTEIRFICNVSEKDVKPKFLSQTRKSYVFEVETPLSCKVWPEECSAVDHIGARIDLSPLRKNSNNWVTWPSYTGIQYHINVCGPLNPILNYTCADGSVGACKTDTNSSISLGVIASGPKIVGSNTLVLQYKGGSPCHSGGRHSMHIEFSCSRVTRAPVFVKETSNCVHHFSWETSVACPMLVTTGENCRVRELQYGHMFNLMSLHKPHDRYSVITERGDAYHINVCGPLNKSCNGQNASVCLVTRDNRELAIGLENNTVVYNNGGLRFVLRGEGCKPGKNSSTVNIILLCKHDSDIGQPEMFPEDDDCNFFFVWYTAVACTPRKSVDCTVMNNNKFYDLSPLTDIVSNHVVVLRQSKVKFLLNVCHSIVFGHGASCQYTSAACMVNMSDADPTTRYINIGDIGSGPYFENGKLKLKYSDGQICSDPRGGDHISTIITFECDRKMSQVLEQRPGDVCVYEFLWRTSVACPLNAGEDKLQEDDSCTMAVTGTNNRIDLRQLRNRIQTVSDLEGHNYTFVACGNLSTSSCGNSLVGVCQVNVQDMSQFWNAGVGNSRLHYHHGAISLEYTGGTACNGSLRRSTRIEFVCATNTSEQVVFTDESETCTYLISWHTQLACSREVNCFAHNKDSSDPVDLTPLIQLQENYQVPAPNGMVFYINVCRPLLPVRGLSCAGGSSACVARLEHGSLKDEKSLGFAMTPVKSVKGLVSMMYVQGSACSPTQNISTKFDFECDPKSGKGVPEFVTITEDCQYKFLWRTLVTCEPYVQKLSLRKGQCSVKNDQLSASVNLETLGHHGVIQVEGNVHSYNIDLCGGEITSKGKSYGSPTSAVFNYQQQQVSVLFTGGTNCTFDKNSSSKVLLYCDTGAGLGEPEVLTESNCEVVIQWWNTLICEVLIHRSAHRTVPSEDTHNSSVGLAISLTGLTVVVCLLILYFRKAANRSLWRGRMGSFFGMRHNGQFYYSRLEAADEASQLLVCHVDGQESDSDDELLRM